MEQFMGLVGLCIFAYLAYLAANRFSQFKNFVQPDSFFQIPFTKEFWKKVLASKAIRKRFIFTLGIVATYQAGKYIPIPGVDIAALIEFHRQIVSNTDPSGLFGKPGSAGEYLLAVSTANIFHLGLMPYIFACVLVQFFGMLVGPFRKHFFSGEIGRLKVVKYTLVVSVIFSVMVALIRLLTLENSSYGIAFVQEPGWLFRLVASATLVAGYCVAYGLSSLITKKGIGHGVGILVLSDIVAFLLVWGKSVLAKHGLQPFDVFILCLWSAILVLFVLFATMWRKNVYVKVKGKDLALPLRMTWIALVPVGLTQSILLFPATIASFFPNAGGLQDFAGYLIRGQAPYYIVSAILICTVTFAYTAIVISPEHIAAMIRKYGGSDDSKKVEESLYAGLNQQTLLVSFFFILVALLPDFVVVNAQRSYVLASLVDATDVLILIGVCSDILIKIQALLEMDKKNCLVQVETAFDEVEAVIKKNFLKENDVDCVVDPLRYTWGLPIRTALDQYRINVRECDLRKAKELLMTESG